LLLGNIRNGTLITIALTHPHGSNPTFQRQALEEEILKKEGRIFWKTNFYRTLGSMPSTVE